MLHKCLNGLGRRHEVGNDRAFNGAIPGKRWRSRTISFGAASISHTPRR